MTSYDQHKHLHKKEMKARMASDAVDHKKIREKLQDSIDPLDPSSHSHGDLVHVVSSRITTDPTVNVHESVSIGTEMMKQYESTWPDVRLTVSMIRFPRKYIHLQSPRSTSKLANEGTRHQFDIFTHHWSVNFWSRDEPKGDSDV